MQVFDISGWLLIFSDKDIDISTNAKGIYIVKSGGGRMKIKVR
ncbi:MAG TPA: hypothetical protein PK296_04655 [Paludibacteraceae bacterium]|nr:hypothetical protein [Paludibacteraceae bacterium]HOV83685.1 hypothetical protein [Paludibacteraceae bacterium]